MEIILCTKEAADDYLMHWRTKGSKNGVRRWQYENGSLTPEGYKHYAEMYGWGNKLKKAERLQNRADKAADKAERASRKADDDYVKSYKAERKNERWSTERRQEKADRAKEIADESKAKSDLLSVKARQAQNKASDYADKLQRKEDKLSKFMNEDGSLNDEALRKYTYTTGVPGERKMSLVGRMIFGREYSNKFNKDNANKMSKEETKAWEDDERKKFDEESQTENDIRRLSKEMKSSTYRAMNDEQKQKLGEEVATRLADLEKNERGSANHTHLGEAFTNFLYDQLGSFTDDYNRLFKSDKLQSSYDHLKDVTVNQRQKANDIRLRSGKTGDALSQALRSDLDWSNLNRSRIKSQDKLCSEILQELGFTDTPQNRSLVFAYMYLGDDI